MAYSPPDNVIAATPIGLRGEPPGMTSGMFGLSCFTSAGGDQAGWRYLPSIVIEDQIKPALAGLHRDCSRRIFGAVHANQFWPRRGRIAHQDPSSQRGR